MKYTCFKLIKAMQATPINNKYTNNTLNCQRKKRKALFFCRNIDTAQKGCAGPLLHLSHQL